MKYSEYAIRESKRAKHLRLKISPRGGLVVVVPSGYDHTKIPGFIEKNRAWIEKSIRRIEEERATFEIDDEKPLPDRVPLRAISEEWRVEFRLASVNWGRFEEKAQLRLLIHGDIHNHATCRQLIGKWLRYKAKKHLPPWLRSVSREIGLTFGRSTVRNQRSRWASCSGINNISLNQKLLFVPGRLVRHVFIHELCHTVHPSHSPVFWSLFGQKELQYKELNQELRSAWRYVPHWADH